MSTEKQEILADLDGYLKKFKRALDSVRCIGGVGVQLGVVHGDTDTQARIIAAVKSCLKSAEAIERVVHLATGKAKLTEAPVNTPATAPEGNPWEAFSKEEYDAAMDAIVNRVKAAQGSSANLSVTVIDTEEGVASEKEKALLDFLVHAPRDTFMLLRLGHLLNKIGAYWRQRAQTAEQAVELCMTYSGAATAAMIAAKADPKFPSAINVRTATFDPENGEVYFVTVEKAKAPIESERLEQWFSTEDALKIVQLRSKEAA